jgi:hypothetical protein
MAAAKKGNITILSADVTRASISLVLERSTESRLKNFHSLTSSASGTLSSLANGFQSIDAGFYFRMSCKVQSWLTSSENLAFKFSVIR